MLCPTSCLLNFSCFFSTACGEFNLMTQDEEMTVSTINFPDNYTTNKRCFYGFICQTKNTRLNMTFTDFDVESSTNCSKDVAIVRDGTNIKSPIMGRLCGPKSGLARTHFTASGSRMLITFTSDSTITDRGFRVTVACPRKFVRYVRKEKQVLRSRS